MLSMELHQSKTTLIAWWWGETLSLVFGTEFYWRASWGPRRPSRRPNGGHPADLGTMAWPWIRWLQFFLASDWGHREDWNRYLTIGECNAASLLGYIAQHKHRESGLSVNVLSFQAAVYVPIAWRVPRDSACSLTKWRSGQPWLILQLAIYVGI